MVCSFFRWMEIYSKWWALQKVSPSSNVAILGISAKIPGSTTWGPKVLNATKINCRGHQKLTLHIESGEEIPANCWNVLRGRSIALVQNFTRSNQESTLKSLELHGFPFQNATWNGGVAQGPGWGRELIIWPECIGFQNWWLYCTGSLTRWQ